MKLLIVDDHPINLRLLHAQLEREGLEIVDAADGIQALEILRSSAVDAVISDALMPNMDGFRLCLEIRRDTTLAGVPFLIYTSTYSSPGDRKLAADVGADRYVTKPIAASELLRIVGEVIRETRERRPGRTDLPEDIGVIKQYNATLIAKLEQRNLELEKANGELKASESRYHGTLDTMLEGCQILGRDWRYLYLNDAAAWHGNRPKDQLLGRTLLECYPGLETTAVFAALQTCMSERIGARIENEFTYPDGKTAWFELSVQPVPEGVFILSLDITARKKAEAKIREQLDELLRWQDVMLEREERILALKREVNALLVEVGQPPRYGVEFDS